MAFLVSFLIGRFALLACIDSIIPGDAVYADAELLASWYLMFAAADSFLVLVLLMKERAKSLCYLLYLSAVWSCLLALEQVARHDQLQSFDTNVQLLLNLAIVATWTWEAAKWIKSRPQSSSSRP